LIKEIIQNEKPSFNPIFIHGSSGSGKSHLLMALANELKKKKKNVFFVKAQTFTNHVVNAIRQGEIQKFRDIYRNQDFLIIDDIHIFSGKNATQEEFFHTFNTLYLKKSQIVLSANVPPNRLNNIESRLVSRFEWGIVLKTENIPNEQMIYFLNQKLKNYDIELSNDGKKFLIKTFTNTHDLDKALQAILLRTENNINISKDLLINILSDLIEEQKSLKLTPEKIIHTISKYYGIISSDILGKSQTKECSFPRQLSMYFCRKKLNMTYKKIGDLFQRDHSTAITNIKHIKNKEKKIFSILQDITKEIENSIL